DRGRDLGWVLTVRLGDERAQLDALRRLGSDSHADPQIAVQLVVGIPQLVEAFVLDQPGELGQTSRGAALPDADAETHTVGHNLTRVHAYRPILRTASLMGSFARRLRCTHCSTEFALDPLWEGCPACRREDFVYPL